MLPSSGFILLVNLLHWRPWLSLDVFPAPQSGFFSQLWPLQVSLLLPHTCQNALGLCLPSCEGPSLGGASQRDGALGFHDDSENSLTSR